MPRHRTSLVVMSLTSAALLLALTACSGSQPRTSTPSGSAGPADETSSVEPSSSASTSTPGSERVALRDLELRLEPVARGFDQPLFLTNAGDGSNRLFVVEQTGRIRIVRNGRVTPRAFLDVSERISTGGERGLLGLAFAPDYASSGRFYVNYTDRAGDTVIARFIADDPSSDAPELRGPQVVFTVDQPYPNHNGGCIVFAPDGTLWVGMGDGGAAGDPQARAQNSQSLLGKMLSLDVEGGGSGRPRPKIVMRGLRNPWRYSFDPDNDDVWIGDVGQNAWEEIDRLAFSEAQGANLGWNRWEGDHPYPAGASRSRDGFVFPVVEYAREEGQSVTGGYVYRGARYPELDGVYFYADFVSGWIATAREKEGGDLEQSVSLPNPGVVPSSFGIDEDGEIYVCDYQGAVLRVVSR
ncbi:MAG TPA: PQQ-dependent sugar dehydrogenase [Coriobacteriia bacterium]|nr:PQQ-dependent sugar dehydrogenase [Coriobacteriia bacterium]